jgi:hypothetical protein
LIAWILHVAVEYYSLLNTGVKGVLRHVAYDKQGHTCGKWDEGSGRIAADKRTKW